MKLTNHIINNYLVYDEPWKQPNNYTVARHIHTNTKNVNDDYFTLTPPSA